MGNESIEQATLYVANVVRKESKNKHKECAKNT